MDNRQSRPTSEYRAKIESAVPDSRREKVLDNGGTCFLGVSLENDSFRTPKLRAMIQWIAKRFTKCEVLVGDSIHRITLEGRGEFSPSHAQARALQLGKQFVEKEAESLALFDDQVDISFEYCSKIQDFSIYQEFYSQILSVYEGDDLFRKCVDGFAKSYHMSRTKQKSNCSLKNRIRMSADYFLEEFAIFCCLVERGNDVMVYPGSFSALTEIVEGKHPAAPAVLQKLTLVTLSLKRKKTNVSR